MTYVLCFLAGAGAYSLATTILRIVVAVALPPRPIVPPVELGRGEGLRAWMRGEKPPE